MEPKDGTTECRNESRPQDLDTSWPVFSHGIRRKVCQPGLQVWLYRHGDKGRTPASGKDNGERREQILHVLGRVMGLRSNQRRPRYVDTHRG